MRIKKYYILTGISFTVILLSLIATMLFALETQKKLSESTEHRSNALQLSTELFNSSEELTRFARTYVVTGNSVYKDMYNAVLDIRNGTIARPDEYSPTYWHLHNIKKLPEESSATKAQLIPLHDKIIKEVGTKEEIDLLALSHNNSDKLVLLERRAFAAMEGYFPDKDGKFTVKKQPDQALAIRLLFSQEYAHEKFKIMQPIAQFMSLLDKRTQQDIDKYESRLHYFLLLTILITLAAIGAKHKWVKHSINVIQNPLVKMHQQVDAIINGSYNARCTDLNDNEIGDLGIHFNDMAEKLEAERQIRNEAENILRKSEENIRRLVDSAAEAMFGIDLQGRCTFANAFCLNLLGYENINEVLGKDMDILIHGHEDTNKCNLNTNAEIRHALCNSTPVHIAEDVFHKKNGNLLEVEYWSYPVIEKDAVKGAVITFLDISERKRMQQFVYNEVNRLKTILHASKVGTWEWDVETGVMCFNDIWTDIVGYSMVELEPMSINTLSDLIHPEDKKDTLELLDACAKKSSTSDFVHEFRLRHKTGSWIWVLGRGSLCHNESSKNIPVMSGTITDISLRKAEEEKIRYLATHDALTAIPNRSLAKDRYNIAKNLSERHNLKIALLFIDLDNFKPINDRYGHDAGDAVLLATAKRLMESIRESDTAARLGGDEFILIINELRDMESTIPIAQKILNSLTQPITYKSKKVSVSASIGIAVFPDDAKTFDELLEHADKAMYRVKKDKKNNVSR